MRGATLFSELTNTDVLPPKQHKGRSPQLIEKRNELLIHRYVFYTSIRPTLNYEFVIGRLSEELHLSPCTIPQIIEDNRGKAFALRKREPTKIYFQKKYPHFVWDAKYLLAFN